uniref:Retrovirus-related Pol polyprotein from transposon TNT 1-94 n=1 Tax=Tanacetum cinerariifolium TaxID=118510 RepID=A0A699H514_TANCI|nr:retrovirus-related Pol polyprotein from transposon TNT 1-94 [Tanacetum cinerariifolium]
MQVTLHYEAIVMQVTLHDKRIVMQVALHYEAIIMQVTLHDKRIVIIQAKKKKELEQEYILIPICTIDPLNSQGPKDNAVDAAKKATEVDESRVLDNGGQDDQVTRTIVSNKSYLPHGKLVKPGFPLGVISTEVVSVPHWSGALSSVKVTSSTLSVYDLIKSRSRSKESLPSFSSPDLPSWEFNPDIYEPTSVEEKLERKNEIKSRGTLLMALLNKDQLKFHSYQDTKFLMEAIEKRYGGNKKSKKPNSPQLAREDLEQIDPDDLEEIDLHWEMDMLTIRARRFIKRTGSSSSLDSELDSCSKTCLKAYATLKEQYDSLSSDYKKSQFNLVSFKVGLQSLEERLVHYKKNEAVFEEKVNILNLEVRLRDNAIVEYTKKLEKAEKERDELKQTLENTVETKPVKKNSFSPPIIEGWIFNDESKVEFEPKVEDKTVRPSIEKIKFVKHASKKVEKIETPKQHKHYPKGNQRNWNNIMSQRLGNPQQKENKEKGVINSGCSRHIIGNKCYLIDYENYDGGFVSFGDAKGRISRKGKIKTETLDFDDVYFCNELKYNLFSVSQMCDKKNNVLFIVTECLVLSSNDKLLDESQVLLRVPRKDSIYSVNLKSVVPTGEAVNTACYVLNRALVIKPHNKTPYELIHERPLLIEFMKPFGCPITILNTKNYLGKFDEKADEGNGPDWLFDIDSLTISMKYVPVVARFQTNGIAGTKDNIVAGQAKKKKEPEQEYILIPICTTNPLISQGAKDSAVDARKKATEVDTSQVSNNGGQDDQVTRSEFGGLLQQERQTEHINSTNSFNTVSPPVSTAGPSFVDDASPSPINATGTPTSTNAFKENPFERFSPFKNEFSLPLVPIVTLINDTEIFVNAYDDEAAEEEVGINNVVSSYTDERGIVIKNKARLVAQGHTQEEGIDYDEVFVPVARIKAIRLFLAYASFKDFVVYQLDVKSAFLYEKIKEEIYVCHPPGFENPDFPAKVYKVEKALYGLHQAPRHASTVMEPNKALVKDAEAKDVDVHLYRSMIRSLMYLTTSRPDITFAVCACARL